MRTTFGWLFTAATCPLLGAALWVGMSSSATPVQLTAMGLVLAAAGSFGVGSRLLRVHRFLSIQRRTR